MTKSWPWLKCPMCNRDPLLHYGMDGRQLIRCCNLTTRLCRSREGVIRAWNRTVETHTKHAGSGEQT